MNCLAGIKLSIIVSIKTEGKDSRKTNSQLSMTMLSSVGAPTHMWLFEFKLNSNKTEIKIQLLNMSGAQQSHVAQGPPYQTAQGEWQVVR